MSAPSAFVAGAPPSMPAGSHEIRDYYSNQGPPRSSPHTVPSITPYLGLRARLSQVWINRWTVLLLLVLARTLIAISGIDDNLGSARREALSACSDVESMGSAMASMPHYMSQGLNELTATGVEKSVNGLMQMTTLSVTAVEEIIIFIIGILTNTYLCLITLAVTGSLQSVIGVLDTAQKGVSDLTKTIGDDLGGALDAFDSAYNKFVDALSVFSLAGISVPQPAPLDLSQEVESLKNLKLPGNLDEELQKLNDSIPTFDEVKNFTESILRLPFEEVKRLISEEMGNFTFNRSLFAVPQKQQLTFCSDNDGINEFFDDMVDVSALARRIFIGVLLTLAILVMVPMAWREIKRWQKMQGRTHLITENDRDPMDVVYLVSRPYTSSAGLRLSQNFQSQRRRDLVRWVVAYATSDAALFVLALAIAGLFSCICQLILLRSLQTQVPNLTNQVGAFTDQVVASLNGASEQWALDTNTALASTSQKINVDMLGWVDTATTAVNDTLNSFVDKTSEVLNDTFGGTILYDPIKDVLNCLVLMKVEGIQKGLTWVHDNAQVSFPPLANDTFSLGAVASLSSSNADDSFLASPGDVATDKISSAVARFIDAFESAIKTEAIVSTFILLVWILVVFIGIIRALTLWRGNNQVRGDGGAPPIANDFRSDNQDRYISSEFVEIPLASVSKRPQTPAPEYSREEKFTSRYEPHYEDSKRVFAGQRRSYREVQVDTVDSKRASIWNVI